MAGMTRTVCGQETKDKVQLNRNQRNYLTRESQACIHPLRESGIL